MALVKLRLAAADLAAARAAEDLIGQAQGPEPLAITCFETPPAGFLVEAYYDTPPDLAGIAAALGSLGPALGAPTLEPVPDENWVKVSQASLPPVRAGGFIVYGAHDRARVGALRRAIEIEAGEAFGTGHNGTTAGCLAALDAITRRRSFASVLDLGCGTAVLAIAAARVLPRARIIASDNDPIATAVARENVRLNRAASRIGIVTTAGLAHPALRRAQPFDLVLANILPNTLIALAPAFRRAMRPGGMAVLSGILNHQAGEVEASYVAQGFAIVRWRQLSGWTILTLQRR